MHGNLENTRFACQFRVAIFFRERHFNIFCVTCLGAHKLVFKAWNKLSRPKLQLKAFGCATLKGFSVNTSDKVYFDPITLARLSSFAARLEILAR